MEFVERENNASLSQNDRSSKMEVEELLRLNLCASVVFGSVRVVGRRIILSGIGRVHRRFRSDARFQRFGGSAHGRAFGDGAHALDGGDAGGRTTRVSRHADGSVEARGHGVARGGRGGDWRRGTWWEQRGEG